MGDILLDYFRSEDELAAMKRRSFFTRVALGVSALAATPWHFAKAIPGPFRSIHLGAPKWRVNPEYCKAPYVIVFGSRSEIWSPQIPFLVRREVEKALPEGRAKKIGHFFFKRMPWPLRMDADHAPVNPYERDV